MELAPIVMFVYNRADHFKKTFEALSRCNEAKDSHLYIYSDGAKNEMNQKQVDEVRREISGIKDSDLFKSITVIESPENKGLATSVITGVAEIIEKFGKVIVVEDDCMVSPFFLKFMNGALNFYENDKKVGAVSGYCPQLPLLSNYSKDIFFTYRSCSCSWATWKDRFENVDWELKRIDDFYRSPVLIRKLNANGNDRFIRLYRQTKGNGSSWSVRFGAHLVRNNQLTVYPRYSYIQNIGCDASGVHSQNEDAEKMHVDLTCAIQNPQFTSVVLDEKLGKCMKKHYSGGLISNVKRFLFTTFVVLKERVKG
jgi:hypothetical protein